MDDLLADFVAETREMLEQSGSELVAWEANPSDRARLDTIFRFVHTVKGNCGFFDFPRLERLSHAAEDVLAECRAGRRQPDSALVSAVLAIIDRIGAINDTLESDGEPPAFGDDDGLIAALAEDAEPHVFTELTRPDDTSQVQPGVQRSIRLPVDLLDEVLKGVSDMVLARNDLARRLRDAGQQPTIDGPFERLSTILADVRNAITRMRMQRLEHLFSSIPRLTRDLATELGKQVMVDFEGGEVELDREMVDMVRDPLTHIIRNAIDHGIERPADRLRNGKRELGMLRFAARQSGNRIVLTVRDDGAGIDTARLAEKAVERGLMTQSQIEAMPEAARHQLIFLPGLSTSESVGRISGRGVGMDVVRANIERVGGSIDVTSAPGDGTCFTISLPLTLSILAALTVGSGEDRYALPQSFIEEIISGGSAHVDFAQAGDRTLVTFRGRRVPCIALAQLLSGAPDASIDWPKTTLVLVRLASNSTFALAVDRVFDHEDVVVKPIAPAIMASGLYSGTTLLDDGQPTMLLDLPGIAAGAGLSGDMTQDHAEDPTDIAVQEPTFPVMLFTGLDNCRRAIRLELLRRIETVSPDAIDGDSARPQVVIDGRVIPLVGTDAGHRLGERYRLLRLSDGQHELAYAVAQIHDAVDVAENTLSHSGDSLVEAVMLVDGQPVSLLSGHALFAAQDFPPTADHPLTCRIPDDSDWARAILAPLVQSAGYRLASDADDADVEIAFAETAAAVGDKRAGVIRLRSDPEDNGDDTIYRYDSTRLMAALQRAARNRVA